MNDLVLRATVGAQMKAARARAFIASKTQNDEGAPDLIIIIVGVVLALVVVYGIWSFVIQPFLTDANSCANKIDTSKPGTPGGMSTSLDCT